MNNFWLGLLAGFIPAIAGAILSQYFFNRRAMKMFMIDKYENIVVRADRIVLRLNSVFDYIKLVENGPDTLNQYGKSRDILYNEDLLKDVALLELTYCYNKEFYELTHNIEIFTLDIIVNLRNDMLNIQAGNEIDMENLQNVQNTFHNRYGRLKEFVMEKIKETSHKNKFDGFIDKIMGI
jgi:hypothetical protein